MFRLRNFAGWVAVLCVIIGLASQAHAVALDKSFTSESFLDTGLGGTTSAARPELAGTVLEDVMQAFSFSGISGSVQNRVVREDGTGFLDFYWKVNVDENPNGRGAVSALRIGNFGYDFINDADWRIDGLGTAAPYTGRVFNPALYPTGNINFLFSDGLVEPGSESRFFFLHTEAKHYAKTALYDLLGQTGDGERISGIDSTFAPAVPLPAALPAGAVMLLGLGGLKAWRRK